MKIVKLIVHLAFCMVTATVTVRNSAVRGRYCELCNHTLCKYPVEGPSPSCLEYNRSVLLSNTDILHLVTRINERRNLVASGSLSRFPQAANMNKLSWSSKLAKFAQRWADQCDGTVNPNKEDECRDLVSMPVGQIVASVLGPTPRLSVRSFVDVWFMLNLDYKGSVTYYNQSKYFKSNYFTQLIWADTAFVGCGRASFLVDNLNTIVERLVCNFAPKGNNQGKPIYTIGYPGTQCPDQMIPDNEFPSLCQHAGRIKKYFDKGSSSRLLRILNLSNNSLKQELDPNNLKQTHLNSSKTNDRRNQKTRQIYSNISYGGMKRDSIHVQSPMRNIDGYNEPQLTQREYTHERGHSRLYHGFQSSQDPAVLDFTQARTETNYRRIDFVTPAPLYSQSMINERKYMGRQCTRNKLNEHSCYSTVSVVPCKTNECTRGQPTNCPQPACQQATHPSILPASGNKCPCNTITRPIQCTCYQEPTSNCHLFTTTHCPNRQTGIDTQGSYKPFEYYDLFHNLEVKSGDDDFGQNQHVKNLNPVKIVDPNYKGQEYHGQVKALVNRQKALDIEDSYRFSDYSERKKRDLEDQTFKPFWQMDEYNQKRPSELKSIRYTTLENKRYRKTRRTTPTMRPPTVTETITIKTKDSPTAFNNNRGRITEKYLSFDELMHLRKLSTAETYTLDEDIKSNDDTRRKGKYLRNDESTVNPKDTTTMTANTPFKRQKHCTRKLTCTWTAALNGSGGGGGPGGGAGGHDVGSRTPPGYVDGCTRTSTCTRDYMDRNKLASSSEEAMETTLEDEDYCERRSLNKRRRNLDENIFTISSIGYQGAYTSYTTLPLVTTQLNSEITIKDNLETEISSQTDNLHCICYEDTRKIKRREISFIDQLLGKDCNENKNPNTYYHGYPTSARSNFRSTNNIISYRCPCNGIKSFHNVFYRTIMLKYCVTWLFYYLQVHVHAL